MAGLTVDEGFAATSRFINEFHKLGGDSMPALLSDVALDQHAHARDPAAWGRWQDCVRAIKANVADVLPLVSMGIGKADEAYRSEHPEMDLDEPWLLARLDMGDAPLYSAYRWMRWKGHHPFGGYPMRLFLRLVNDLLKREIVQLRAGEGGPYAPGRLSATPRGLKRRYARVGHDDITYDPFMLTLSLGPNARPTEKPAPSYSADVDLAQRRYTLRAAADDIVAASQALPRVYPQLVFTEQSRTTAGGTVTIEGTAAPPPEARLRWRDLLDLPRPSLRLRLPHRAPWRPPPLPPPSPPRPPLPDLSSYELTEEEAFAAMTLFLNDFVTHGGDDVLLLVADIRHEDDELRTADPAAWAKWVECADAVLQPRAHGRRSAAWSVDIDHEHGRYILTAQQHASSAAQQALPRIFGELRFTEQRRQATEGTVTIEGTTTKRR